MNTEHRDDFLRDLAEKIQEINSLYEDYGLSNPTVDCEQEDCELLEDLDMQTLHNLLKEVNVLVEDYIK
jgi:hypothetical protein